MSAQKDRNHPQQLFSINNEGIPWEEASGAKNSHNLLTKWKRNSKRLNAIWILMWVSVAAVILITGLYFGAVHAGFQFGSVAKTILKVLFFCIISVSLYARIPCCFVPF